MRTIDASEAISCPSIEVSPDRHIAAVPVGSTLALLDLNTGKWQRFGALPDEIHSVAWSPDGRLLALAGLDGTARVVRIADGAMAVVARSDAGILGVRFSPDGRQLATGGLEHVVRVVPIDEASLLPSDPAALLKRIAELTRARL